MEQQYYREMIVNLEELIAEGKLQDRELYLFGHCNATEELLELLQKKGLKVTAILDNNNKKWGNLCKGVPIINPHLKGWECDDTSVVCIVSRAYPSMCEQLHRLKFRGEIYKLVDYNTYSEYSLSKDVIERMRKRTQRGIITKKYLGQKYPGHFQILCPFSALGDIFFTMSYLPHFLEKKNIHQCIICVPGGSCKQVVELFGNYPVEAFAQKELDELIQACIYTQGGDFYIAHQDRPYVVNLHKALKVKCIPLETIYKCGVFGLPWETEPYKPLCWSEFAELDTIIPGKSVIFSPHAKSVTTFNDGFWQPIVKSFREQGYQCFTNAAGDEKPLAGTKKICPRIAEIRSVVERAGTFVGIRSGVCDLIRDAACRKIALYPDYNYSDTKWKAIDMYAIDGWENIVVDKDFIWNRN